MLSTDKSQDRITLPLISQVLESNLRDSDFDELHLPLFRHLWHEDSMLSRNITLFWIAGVILLVAYPTFSEPIIITLIGLIVWRFD